MTKEHTSSDTTQMDPRDQRIAELEAQLRAQDAVIAELQEQIRQLQEHFCDRRYLGVSLPGNPDFVKLADAYGIEGYLAKDEDSLEDALDRAISSSGSTLIQVALDPDSNIVPMFPIGGKMRGSK